MITLFRSIFLVLLCTSLLTLSSCGKKDTTSSGDKESTENSKSEDEGNDGSSSGDIDMSTGKFMIEYAMEGPKMSGTMTLYRMGENFKTIMEGNFGGMEGGESVALYKDPYVYSVTNIGGKKTGIKMKVDEYKKDEKNFDMKDIEEQLDKYKKIGTEEILGKECEIYDMGNGSTISVYDKKAVLRMKSKEMTITATKMNDGSGISASDFDVPTDVEFIDMEDMMKGMINLKSLEKLKDMKMPGK